MVEEVNSSMIYLIYFKNFCKCLNVYPPHTHLTQHNNKSEKKRMEMDKIGPSALGP
jgi:hypothetical protein